MLIIINWYSPVFKHLDQVSVGNRATAVLISGKQFSILTLFPKTSDSTSSISPPPK